MLHYKSTSDSTPTPSQALNLFFFSVVSSTNAQSQTEQHSCPIDILGLGVCANVLGLVNAQIGEPPVLPCCSVINGLVDVEAAVCLCSALKANVLGLILNIPLHLNLILNRCGRDLPGGFECT
ncbi:hypothetical protein VNO77_24942 [Canavalia gladiata]|uniref:Bifunctional inhibitor/plant lipid transfer protein/seed storage helical domain-containing protein n=1 Tax=Canavalia gladiata TaxID=3824 RepID=A0AAN9LCF8_CANGL